MKLSVIVAARNAADVLPAQLDALLAQEHAGEWEVVVADNGSTDETVAVVEKYRQRSPRVRLVDAADGEGAGHARNRGMAAADGDAFAFCDADDLVAPGWVRAMADGLGGADAVAGKIRVDELNPAWLQTAFYADTPDGLESFHGIFPFSATCNLGVRRSVADALGGFDESWLTGQDVEFCLRLWLYGHELAYRPDAVVQYRYRPTMRSLWRRSREYGEVAPAIAAQLRTAGRETPSSVAGLRQWVWLLRRLPTLRHRAGRARWVVVAGTKVGRLTGSARRRCLLL